MDETLMFHSKQILIIQKIANKLKFILQSSVATMTTMWYLFLKKEKQNIQTKQSLWILKFHGTLPGKSKKYKLKAYFTIQTNKEKQRNKIPAELKIKLIEAIASQYFDIDCQKINSYESQQL